MLEVRNLDILVNTRYIIKNLSFNLNKNDKLAIIGEEGNGKSTLLKAILGLASYAEVTGTIQTFKNRIGYLKQSLIIEELNQKVYNYLFLDEADYYNKINNLYKYLENLNISDGLLNQELNTLSGGEKVKISILKLLLDESDILFLDEPTNDLDIETLEWLEEFINNSDKPIIYVSHDETLLTKTANKILHLEQLKKKTECKYTFIKSSYDDYINARVNSIEKQMQIAASERREYDKKVQKLNQIMQKVEHAQNTISRSDPHGGQVLKKKMHALKSQEVRLDEKDLTAYPDIEESINFFFEDVKIPRSKIILNLDMKELRINEKVLANNVKLEVVGNKHVCIIGNNGVGKTTLLKEIYKQLSIRKDIVLGYMPQQYEEILNNYDNAIDFICKNKTKDEITLARSYLGNMKFTHDEMTASIKDISSGTKAKLFLVKLVLDKCNVLILDEPTRNVSPLSNPVIRKVLKEFNGTIISISHDRKYIAEVIDDLYVLTKDGLIKMNNYKEKSEL